MVDILSEQEIKNNEQKTKNKKMVKTYYIKTFGCQQNKADSERIEGWYQARGYQPARSLRETDEIVINTCSVRQRAEDRVEGFIHNVVVYFNKVAKTKKRPKIILTGCMVHHGKEKLLEMMPEIDEVLPVNEVGFNQAAVRRDKVHAWVPISEGCNSFCSYCIVPYARGRERSRPMEDVMEEVTDLANKGYRKITLLGQNVNSYGLEKIGIGYRKRLLNDKLIDTPPFVKLLQVLSQIEGIEWIRFLTSNPWDFRDELIEEIARNKKIDRFIHLPVQSGSDRILKLMNRGYTRDSYLKLVKKLRQALPEVKIGTDIIVGFPTETEGDFQATVDLARQADWVVAFVAQYSPRPGTVAARFEDDVPCAEKKRRWLILDEMINRKKMGERPWIG